MSHCEQFAMVIIVRVGGIIRELSTCGTRLTLPVFTLFFMVTDLPTIVVGKWHCLPILFSMECKRYCAETFHEPTQLGRNRR